MIGDRYSRQSFLGSHAEAMISSCMVGVVGLGGGGSHIIQQLAHIGFRQYVLYDNDVVEESNLNRLIGATKADAISKTPKIEVARRMIDGLQPGASIDTYQARWQEQPYALRGCDVIFGCVDGLAERRELEACARRYVIPYIDIGIDVHQANNEPPMMSGQVILSMPGGPCLMCLGFLNEDELSNEAARYGKAGPMPQVVWANGVLASTAVGIAIDLLTGWTKVPYNTAYICYYGNQALLKPHIRLDYLEEDKCPHYSTKMVGDPRFILL